VSNFPSEEELAAREQAIEGELKSVRERIDELSPLEARARDLEEEISEVSNARDHVRRSASLPVLDDISIPTKCKADWNQMTGTDTIRHCLHCNKNVYNISAMTRDEAAAFLQDRHGKDTCIRLYRRPDGTVVNQSCERTRKRPALWMLAGAALASGTTAGAMMLAGGSEPEPPRPACKLKPMASEEPTEIIGAVPLETVPEMGQVPVDIKSENVEEMGKYAPEPDPELEPEMGLMLEPE
jgi:hypothetical protein